MEPPRPFLRDRDRIVAFVALAILFDGLSIAAWLAADGRAALDAAADSAAAGSGASSRSTTGLDGPPIHRVDLLRAPAGEIAILPEVGIARARELVRARESGFSPEHVEDLRAVRGFGASTIARMRPYVTLGSASLGGAGPGTANAAGAARRLTIAPPESQPRDVHDPSASDSQGSHR